MTLAKAFVSGNVVKAPEKRFTQNDMAISSFTINIDANNETLIRVSTFGQLAETVCATVAQGDMVAVEGKLQINSYKLPNGMDRKVFEISASAVEKMNANANIPVSQPIQQNQNEQIVSFNQDEIAQDLIDDDEIPF